MVWLPLLSFTSTRATVMASLLLPVIRPEMVELVELSKLFIFTVPLAFVEVAVKKRLAVGFWVQVPFLKKYLVMPPGWLVTIAVPFPLPLKAACNVAIACWVALVANCSAWVFDV